MNDKKIGSFLLVVMSTNTHASYMGGPEVFQYFFIVLLIGGLAAIFLSMERDYEGKIVAFKLGKFFLLVVATFIVAIFAGLVGLEVGRP